MTDRFEIIPLKELLKITLHHLKNKNSIFGIQKELIFKAGQNDPFRMHRFNRLLETPLGVAAGPHTQMAQNIVAAWLTGARFIELKTVQTLDELEVSKPCIDMQDEGYNCEWSQELKIEQSFEQYLNAWILIHILKRELGLDMRERGFIFNMSVGYDYQGIMKPNVQWFLDKMNDASTELKAKIAEIEDIYPAIKEMEITPVLSDNITLSTMHGCPPDEIEKIALYLINDRKLHTAVKLNPTLLGKEKLYAILNNSGFKTKVPDIAFEHDLKYADAVKIIANLQEAASANNLFFGIKLTNTLESVNNKNIFNPREEMMYMSGRALHPISVNLALKLQKEFDGKLDISFSGGADAFNVSQLIASGLAPVTVCSDILKPGGYGRLKQYIREISNSFEKSNAESIDSFIESVAETDIQDRQKNAFVNLKNYAAVTLQNDRYKKKTFSEPSIKTKRALTQFDCIHAPCTDTCPTNQDIPGYMYHTAKGDFKKAFEVIMLTNPFPNTTGMVCDHICTTKCTRMNYDEPLRIREIKRFVTGYAAENNYTVDTPKQNGQGKVAIIGAGPSGLSAAWFLKKAGFDTVIYEAKSRPGGMVSGAIPSFRLPGEAVNVDFNRIEALGVKIVFDTKVDKAMFQSLAKDNDYVFIAAGAQKSRKLFIEGIENKCVKDPLEFLYKIREGKTEMPGKRVAVIGGGNTAMDVARTCLRLAAKDGKVTVLYRRGIADMPADPDEVKAALDEGAVISEFVSPVRIAKNSEGGCTITLIKMKAGKKDADGRAHPVPVEGSEFNLEFDTIIPAIGQDAAIDFVDAKLLKTAAGSYKTGIDNVYIGGDALRGASTVINAVADGRKAAEEMIENHGINAIRQEKPQRKEFDIETHMVKRAAKVYSAVNDKTINNTLDFSPVEKSFTPQEAMKEASRCLLCDEVCNICTTVCPNLAFHGFNTEPVIYNTEKIVVKNGAVSVTGAGTFEIKQKYQILHLADWCNECGNCATFCPSAGKPYTDKPHLYFKKSSFEQNRDGYYYDNGVIYLYRDNEKFSFSEKEKGYIFENRFFSAEIDKQTFKVKKAVAKENGTFETSLELAARMKTVLEGAKSFTGGGGI